MEHVILIYDVANNDVDVMNNFTAKGLVNLVVYEISAIFSITVHNYYNANHRTIYLQIEMF